MPCTCLACIPEMQGQCDLHRFTMLLAGVIWAGFCDKCPTAPCGFARLSKDLVIGVLLIVAELELHTEQGACEVSDFSEMD